MTVSFCGVQCLRINLFYSRVLVGFDVDLPFSSTVKPQLMFGRDEEIDTFVLAAGFEPFFGWRQSLK